MKNFSPFKINIDELTTKDLSSLKEITEGWYIEYKSEVPKSEAIAKSIAAMANTYGGWIFYGVAEESKQNSVAGAFPGIAITAADTELQKIRQAVSIHLNSDCHFDVKILSGQCEEIGLNDGRCIICVAVPQSIEAPHIHSRGVIYRRVGDSSDPVAETDRHMIEKMFQRSESRIKEFENWISKNPELSDQEQDISFLRILIHPNLRGILTTDYPLSIENVKAALNKSKDRLSYIPFDTIHTSAQTIVARHCGNKDPRSLRLTWNIQKDLSGEVIIPLRSLKGSADEIAMHLSKYKHVSPFISALKKSNTEQWKIVDLSMAYSILTTIVECQRELQARAGWPLDFHIKIKTLNAWRVTPFLDIESYIDQIDRNGLPVNLTSECVSPPGTHPDTFWHAPNEIELESTRLKVAFQAAWAFYPLAGAFGISIPDIITYSDNIYGELQDAGRRASNNQKP
ncbi:ATP-binding protein [Pseudomonas paraversuta]|uniref:AlbA family DNA-binding domain-containing protein n=1 Tax=Pseudomonas paraversuta TaxID=2750624 RepID=UPI003D2DF8AD